MYGVSDYGDALRGAQALMASPQNTPSARVLDRMAREHGHGFSAFACQQARMARDVLLQEPWSAEQQARYVAMANHSLAAQKDIEAADSLPFEAWREQYMAVEELG